MSESTEMRTRVGSNVTRVANALITAGVLIGGVYLGFFRTDRHPARQDDQTMSAITQLSSGDATTREAAKVALLERGPESLQTLIAALQELQATPKPHFELGNEREGAKWLREQDKLPVGERDVSESLSVDITWRLKRDLIEMLGRLHDEAAVPILLDLTRQEIHTSQNEYLRPPMFALIEIGTRAVPKVIEALETVQSTEATALSNCCPNLNDEERRNILQSQEEIAIARLAIVLGEIRDQRALPILEKLMAPPRRRDAYPAEYIKIAVAKIKAGNK